MDLESHLKHIGHKYNNIIIIVLFGSHARNDYDEYSDIDIFILIKNCSFDEYIDFKNKVIAELKIPLDYVSIYTYEGIKSLKEKGSYFLWHLKKEGILIYDSDNEFNYLFDNLKKYDSIKNDLFEYNEICKDIIVNRRYGLDEVCYDLSVLASIIRNCCIAISYLHGEYLFDRIKPVKYVKEMMGEEFPFTLIQYENIYRYRIRRSRNKCIYLEDISEENLKNWSKKAIELIRFGLHILDKGGDTSV